MYNFRTSLVLLIPDSLVACEMFDLDSEIVSEWVKCVYLEYLPKGPSWTLQRSEKCREVELIWCKLRCEWKV